MNYLRAPINRKELQWSDITTSEMAYLQTKAWSCQHAKSERESMLIVAASVSPMVTGNLGLRASLNIGIFPTRRGWC